jgi:hypothetical protein
MQVTPPEAITTEPAGVPEGTELTTDQGIEVVVNDYDEAGNVIGWHKEVKGDA